MPNGSMLKFFQDRGGPSSEHGGKLHWPGTPAGFPFRGDQVPNLQGDEAENLPHALDYHSQSFRLWLPEEKAAFDSIMDRIVNGWYMQHKRYDNYVPDHQEYVVRLEWVQVYGETPAGKVPGSGYDDSDATTSFPLGPASALQAG
jgi:hypothetical protein